jgi:GH43 family beta-xylosidase
MGYLHADENADLMRQESWTKNPFPVLSTHDFDDGQQGPGHNSFTRDELGNTVLCYHSRTKGEPGDGGLDDPGRHARIKPIHFARDGRPVLNMSLEEELRPDLSSFSIKVKVLDRA